MNFVKILISILFFLTSFQIDCFCKSDLNSNYSYYSKSKKYIDSIINILNQHSFSFLGLNFDSAKFYSSSALKLSQVINSDSSMAISMINLAFSLNEKNDSLLKILYIKNAIKIFKTKNDIKCEALIRTKIGDNYRKINNYEQALKNYFSALNIYLKLKDNKNIVFILNDKIGELYMDKSQFSKAIDVLFKSLKISEENDDSCGIADASTNIGVIYINQNNFDNANRYINRALRINEYLGRKKQIAKCLINLGVNYAQKDSIQIALDYYLKGLKINIQLGDKIQSEVYINIGRLYQIMGNFNLAENYYIKALNNAEEEKSEDRIMYANMYLGDLFKETGNLNLAEDYFLRCVNRAKTINSLYWLSYIYISLANISKDQKDFRSAYNYLLIYTEYNDSMNNIEKNNEIIKIEMKYEQDKKDVITEQEKKNLTTIMISFIIGTGLLLVLAFYIYLNYRNKKRANKQLEEKNKIISFEQEKSEKLLLNILPETIALRLKNGETSIADHFDEASVIFIDIVDFTKLSLDSKPQDIVNMLNDIFTAFDKISSIYGIEKIKTIGDCYMAAAGIPIPRADHTEAIALMALDSIKIMNEYKNLEGKELKFRIGLDCGPTIAGVIGRQKFIYDLWGDMVNTASRMESYGVTGKIQCTDRFKNRLIIHNEKWIDKFEERGEVEIKGKGKMKTWFLK